MAGYCGREIGDVVSTIFPLAYDLRISIISRLLLEISDPVVILPNATGFLTTFTTHDRSN